MTTTDVLIDVQTIGSNDVTPLIKPDDYLGVIAGWYAAKAGIALGNTADIARSAVRVTFGGDVETYHLEYITSEHMSEVGLLTLDTPQGGFSDFEVIAVQISSTYPGKLVVLPVVARTQGVYEGDTGARLYGAILHAILESRNIRLRFER